MKLENAVVGLQVFVKDSRFEKMARSGKVQVAVIKEVFEHSICGTDVRVEFSDGDRSCIKIQDVRKATLDDAGTVVRVLKSGDSRSLAGSVKTVCKSSEHTESIVIAMSGVSGWKDPSIGAGTYWHVNKGNVSIINTVSDFLSANK